MYIHIYVYIYISMHYVYVLHLYLYLHIYVHLCHVYSSSLIYWVSLAVSGHHRWRAGAERWLPSIGGRGNSLEGRLDGEIIYIYIYTHTCRTNGLVVLLYFSSIPGMTTNEPGRIICVCQLSHILEETGTAPFLDTPKSSCCIQHTAYI